MASSGLALFVYGDLAAGRSLRMIGLALVAIAVAASFIWRSPRR